MAEKRSKLSLKKFRSKVLKHSFDKMKQKNIVLYKQSYQILNLIGNDFIEELDH